MLARFSTHLAEWYYMGSAVQTVIISRYCGRGTTCTRVDIEQGANRDVLFPNNHRCIPSIVLSRFSSSTLAHRPCAPFANFKIPLIARIPLDDT